ncbi:MAG: adenylate/guanylate cyclase domain-containing protein [Acidimicrobiia bacterium]
MTPDNVFLFSDIEGSTRLWDEFPKAMEIALETHDTIVLREVENAGGALVKTTGDGVMAVFEAGRNAVDAGRAIQLAVDSEEWGEIGGLRIRMGLHQGDAQKREDDYFGPTVNRTARLMSAGHGGQVLMSAELARHLPASVQMRDMGIHRLRDLAEPEHIFQLVIPGLDPTFPPLVTLDVTPNNLPSQTSSFLGRDNELKQIRELLESGASRLITLLGPGGTGKTRLALQAAADQVDRFRDGVFFVDLSTESELDESLVNVARAVGIDSASDESALDALKRGLDQNDTLLILDNLEQINGIGLGIDQLLKATPRLVVLGTSRAPLRVRSEQLYPVEPLGLPDSSGGTVTATEVLASEAALLFIERASQQSPGFALDDVSAPIIASICVRLDGLPLAVELAAARLRMFSLSELDSRLNTKLDVLTGGAHDLPERQKTLRNTIEWSHDLLTDTEKALLRLLSVFAGSTVGDVEEVAGRTGLAGDVFGDLASLVDKSLVRKLESRSGGSRFSLLETIRSFTRELAVDEPDEFRRLEYAHASYFADTAEALARTINSVDAGISMARIGEEIENLQVAWRFWMEEQDLTRLHQLLDPIWILYDSEGWYQGAMGLAEDLLMVLAERPDSPERTAEQIAVETSLARARLLVRGYNETAEMEFLQALKHAEESGSVVELFPVIRSLATFYALRGDMEKTLEMGSKLMAMAEASDDPALSVDANLVAGVGAAFTTQFDLAISHLDAAIAAFDPSEMRSARFRLGPHSGIISLTTSALLSWMGGNMEMAIARADQALTDSEELGHSYSRAYALYHVAYLGLFRQDLTTVVQCAHDLLAIANRYDYQIWRALAIVLLGVVKAMGGDPQGGKAEVDRGMELYARLPTPPVFWGALLQLRAEIAALAGDMDGALEMATTAVSLNIDPDSGMAPEMLVTQGDLLLSSDRDKAAASFEKAMLIARSYGFRLTELRALTRLTRLDREEWHGVLSKVYDDFTEGFEYQDLIQARETLDA